MTNKNDLPVRLHYLGERRYVDISTIDACFLTTLGLDPADLKIGWWQIRVLTPIRHHGYLVVGKHERASCLFEFEYDRKTLLSYSYIEMPELIVERRPEVEYVLHDHIRLDGRHGYFIRPITNVRTYNFMALGKAVVLNNTSKIPRVVRSRAWASLSLADYSDVDMTYTPLRNDFAVLRTGLRGSRLGEIVVKLLDAEEVAKGYKDDL